MFVSSFLSICELVQKRKWYDIEKQTVYIFRWYQNPLFLLGKEVKLKIISMAKKVWGGFNVHDGSAIVMSYLKHTYTVR
jgi:hypothetical protein